MSDVQSDAKKDLSPGMRMALDFGPVLVFFVVNFLAPPPLGIFYATGAFMAAMMIALVISWVKAGKISPMLLFSGVMVLVFGGVTLFLRDETFIKVKPTIYYVFIALLLIGGLITKRPTLAALLGSAYPGLSDRGWDILSRNWAIFFLAMAVLNEAVWRNSSTDFWVGFKLWGAIPLTLIFAFANVPMLLKHGLNLEKADEPPMPDAHE
ncbi:septation protein A [Parasphingopyxis lamellibrachiae]|uniref:Inner membrane-spanning protein YciB n=1 Tax=Parasphingopyxis lamellibrachiae TaxID=680125 RepID=A0A3D9FCS5_9SPHN|nr:septation protein A [Parasphingopyxis lamellibrachiae]RED15468.1 intracellular septation protein A [Parasphingopyxis lamellibrachiae]